MRTDPKIVAVTSGGYHSYTTVSDGPAWSVTYNVVTLQRDGTQDAGRMVNRITSCVNACAGIEDPAAYIEAMRRELRRLVNLCDTEATMFDGSNPDTRAAHALLGDFDKPADEDDGGWRY